MYGVLLVAPVGRVLWEPPPAAATVGSAGSGMSTSILMSPSAMLPLQEETGDSDEVFITAPGAADEGDVESCSSGGGGADEAEGGMVGDSGSKENEENGCNGCRAAAFSSAAPESSDWDEAEKSRRFWETCLQSGYP